MIELSYICEIREIRSLQRTLEKLEKFVVHKYIREIRSPQRTFEKLKKFVVYKEHSGN